MSESRPTQVMQILAEIGEGDPRASDDLLVSVYDELRKLAQYRLGNEPPGLTLEATALVHEAYLRLIGSGGEGLSWDSRGHFFSAAAEAMRRILVERARRYGARKHGGGRKRMPLAEVDLPATTAPYENLLALDEALQKLDAEEPGRTEVLKLRYFAGLSVEDTAEVLGISVATVKRRSRFAQAWLCRTILRSDESADCENSVEPDDLPPTHS